MESWVGIAQVVPIKTKYLVNENGEEEQISYEICAGVFAANEADIAKLKAAAADAAAARAALKAGLTCSVEDNCVGGDVNVETACVLGDDGDYTCEIKESENPEGVVTADGSNTAPVLLLQDQMLMAITILLNLVTCLLLVKKQKLRLGKQKHKV